MKNSTGHFKLSERDFHAVHPCLPGWLVLICALKVDHGHFFILASVEDLQNHEQPPMGASHPAPGAVPASSWLPSASLLPFPPALAPAWAPNQTHYIRSVTATVHKWCVGAGTSWGEWSHGLS